MFANLQFMFLNIHDSFSHRTEQYSSNGNVDFILFVMLMLGQQLFTDPRLIPFPNHNFHNFEWSEGNRITRKLLP